jgi:hypothetical protein
MVNIVRFSIFQYLPNDMRACPFIHVWKYCHSLNDLASKMSCNNRSTILRGKETGQWLPVLPSTVNGTELSAQEFRDALLLRYARCPPDLPIQCNRCQHKFSVRHALECKRGGLVISWHNEI